MGRPRRRWWGRSCQWAGAIAVCASALALGGADVRVVLVAAIVTFICGLFALRAGYLERVPPTALVLMGLSIYTLLQACPLPVALVRRLSPSAAAVWQYALSPFKEEVPFASLSLDPGASCIEATKFAAYAIAFTVAAGIARRRGATPVVALVFFSALILTLVTAAHAAVGATSVFGVYVPKFARPGIRLGPMLNANCFAGYLVLGVLCGLGLGSSGTRNLRPLYLSGAVLMSAGVAVSGSRAGFFVLLIAVTLFVLLGATRLRYGRHLPDWRVVAGIAGCLSLGIVLALWFVPGSWELLVQRDVDKLRMWKWVLPLLRDFSVFGVGRGAFESIFPRYKPPVDTLTYSHPENIIAQWGTEWGVVGLAALMLVIWQMRPSGLALRRHPAALGAILGVAAITAQNLLDLGLELFASMLAVVVLLGACWGQAPKAQEKRKSSGWVKWSLFSTALFALVAAFAWGRDPLELERDTFIAKTEQDRPVDAPGQEALLRSIRAAMLRHPAEHTFARLGALIALRTGGNVLPWVGRALELCETDSRSHWLLALALHRHGLLSQALLEARLSAEYDRTLAATVGTIVAGWSKRADELERAAPPGPPGAVVLYAQAVALPGDANAPLRETLLRQAIRRDPAEVLLQVTLAKELLNRLSNDQCTGRERQRCVDEILALATTLGGLAPESAAASQVLSGLYSQTRDFEEAERRLTPRCQVLEGLQQFNCWDALLSVALTDVANKAFVDRVTRRLVRAACLDEENCPAALLRAGEAMAKASDWLEALEYFERAATKAPSVSTLLRVADTAGMLGRGAVVARALSMARHARVGTRRRFNPSSKGERC